ncbi:MAG: UDP-N-acetylmuramoyl-tripeptide--D-alanyl-D-alanine ligase [Oceanicoccus sp.]|jgi:UDP-N-acetylmuramoyl-tripeptide--D-alanyl-D-alanine ligase
MKALIRNYVIILLRFLAQRRLTAIKPTIVGVTGSVGKTGAKEAIADVLERRQKVKRSQKNYNSEFGAVLTILDQKTGYSSANQWIRVVASSLWQSLKAPEAYDTLVMEMGVDSPGDMDEILKVFTPNIMVYLNVMDAHIGETQFPNRQAIFEEKAKAVVAVKKNDWVVLNIDDNFVKQLEGKLPAHTVSIGMAPEADVRASNIRTDERGLHFDLNYDKKVMPVHLPHVLGDCHVTIALAAIAVGFIQGMPWAVIEKALEEFQLPPGRMNKIEGLNDSLIIDSSYNASPSTMTAALQILSEFPGRRIAALGTMNELGQLTDSAHMKLGKQASEKAHMLIAVGKQAKQIAEGAQRGGMSASMIHLFRTSKEAGEFLRGILDKQDVVLAKGSQNGVRMEHLVKLCMKNPKESRKKLIRQEPYWMTQL